MSTTIPTCAVDLDGTDQSVSGTNWVKISWNRVLWDSVAMLDSDNHYFLIPKDAVYISDIAIKLNSFVNVTSAELAIFKVQEGADDYWFQIDYKERLTQNSLMLKGSMSFDFHEGEQYYLALKLTTVLLTPSCQIEGDDDYTAFGFNHYVDLSFQG